MLIHLSIDVNLASRADSRERRCSEKPAADSGVCELGAGAGADRGAVDDVNGSADAGGNAVVDDASASASVDAGAGIAVGSGIVAIGDDADSVEVHGGRRAVGAVVAVAGAATSDVVAAEFFVFFCAGMSTVSGTTPASLFVVDEGCAVVGVASAFLLFSVVRTSPCPAPALNFSLNLAFLGGGDSVASEVSSDDDGADIETKISSSAALSFADTGVI
jgi:hypothetical protein